MFETDVLLPWLLGRPEAPAAAAADGTPLPPSVLLRPVGMAGIKGCGGNIMGHRGCQWLCGMLEREI